MGRGRGKGKKSTNGSDETGSGPDEIIPIQKRRGRPHKPLKDESDDEDQEEQDSTHQTLKTDADSAQKDETREGLKPNSVILTKEAEKNAKKKRKKQGGNVKEEREKEERETGHGADVAGRVNGFRQSNNRRKSKPRRAAEAGIQCDW